MKDWQLFLLLSAIYAAPRMSGAASWLVGAGFLFLAVIAKGL